MSGQRNGRRGLMRSSSTGTGMDGFSRRRLEDSMGHADDIGVSGMKKSKVRFPPTDTTGTEESRKTGRESRRLRRAKRISVAHALDGTLEAAKGLANKLETVKMANVLSNFAVQKIKYDERAAWNPRMSSSLVDVTIHVSCKNLPSRITQPNPFAVLFEVPRGYTGFKKLNDGRICPLPRPQEHEVGRTEVIQFSPNPVFKEPFQVQYQFENEQTYLVRIYDNDLQYSSDLKEHTYLGGFVFTLGELLSSHPHQKLTTNTLDHENPDACLVLQGRETDIARKFLEFRFAAHDLMPVDSILSTSKVYYFFMIETWDDEAKEWEPVWKSEGVIQQRNPTWSSASLSLLELCDGDLEADIRVTFWENQIHHDDIYLGCAETTVRELVEMPEDGIMIPIKIRKKIFLGAGTKVQKAGKLQVIKSHLVERPSFLQYISGGCEIDLIVAVDCGAMVMHQDKEKAVHFHNGSWKNNYQMALEEIGTLMEEYSQSHHFRMWGFNAQQSYDTTENVFVLDEKIAGSEGLLKTYNKYLMGPNRFFLRSPESMLESVVARASYRSIAETEKRHCYSLLCILTSQEPEDPKQTVDAILRAATDSPISIVVIGCGDGSLDQLEKHFEKSKVQRSICGIHISRDVLSFTSFAQFGNDTSKVIAEGLQELPEQMVQRFYQSGIDPKPPPKQGQDTTINVHKAKKEHSEHSGHHRKRSPKSRHGDGSPHRDRRHHKHSRSPDRR